MFGGKQQLPQRYSVRLQVSDRQGSYHAGNLSQRTFSDLLEYRRYRYRCRDVIVVIVIDVIVMYTEWRRERVGVFNLSDDR